MSPQEAAAAMRAADLRAPLACDTAESIAAHGACFRLEADAGAGVFVLRAKGEALWVDGAAQTRPGAVTATGLALFEQIARQTGHKKVAFQTVRRGLVRLARKDGYRVVGFILEKDI